MMLGMPPTTTTTDDDGNESAPTTTTSFPSPLDIASAALDHYEHELPQKGKPRDKDEWTVCAAIVASFHHGNHGNNNNNKEQLTVIASATGTKCTAVDAHSSETVLHDSHAEVLARRGLLRVLWHEIVLWNSKDGGGGEGKGENNDNDESKPPNCTLRLLEKLSNDQQYRLRPNVHLHLYVSDAPCGDASIYPLKNDSAIGQPSSSTTTTTTTAAAAAATSSTTLQFTGAKIIVSPATQVPLQAVDTLLDQHCAREQVQLLGRLRSKSARSNLQAHQRSRSLSCSDKLVRWSVLGCQGTALLQYLVEPIYLTSIVTSRDARAKGDTAQLQALQRALVDRVKAVQAVWQHCAKEEEGNIIGRVPTVHVVDRRFVRGKAAAEQQQQLQQQQQQPDHTNSTTTTVRKRKHDEMKLKTSSPTGVAINWNAYDRTVELTVGARGTRQGKKSTALASRLSRHGLWQIMQPMISSGDSSYAACKESVTRQHRLREIIFRKGPLAGWLLNDTDQAQSSQES